VCSAWPWPLALSWPAGSPVGGHNLSTRLKQQEHLRPGCILIDVRPYTEQAFEIVRTHSALSETNPNYFLLSRLVRENQDHRSDKAEILQPCDPETWFSSPFPVGPSSLYCCRFGFGSPTFPPQPCSISGKRSNRPRALSLLTLLSISLLLRRRNDTHHSPIRATNLPLAQRHPL
jgi:hypothetical protein